MCANMQCCVNEDGENCIVVSERAYKALNEDQRFQLKDYRLVICNVDTLEAVAGGSTRCMLSENY